MVTIEVEWGGKSVAWTALNKKSAIEQAKREAASGGTVTVKRNGKAIWSSEAP